MKVKIKLHGSAKLPETHGDWTDLATAEDVEMKKGELKLISLGVSMELPEGYYAKLLPRSSTPKKWGVIQANSIGIIDHEYNGDDDIWMFAAYAIRDTKIPRGTRLCQFCVVKQEEAVEFIPVESLGNDARGGFGSTGEK